MYTTRDLSVCVLYTHSRYSITNTSQLTTATTTENLVNPCYGRETSVLLTFDYTTVCLTEFTPYHVREDVKILSLGVCLVT